mgnify:CR=1 FL=1
MQTQFNKSGVENTEVKDHIFTNRSLKVGAIVDSTGKANKQQLLPSNNHPYDHFYVIAQVVITQKAHKSLHTPEPAQSLPV